MCAVFGIHDYGDYFNNKQKSIIISVLSQVSEVRGIDATGIAYVKNNRLQIYKRPLPARRMKFNLPSKVKTVMGHTRMTTQGNEKFNFNNHPFFGRVKGNTFALAHNGVLYQEKELRQSLNLPDTHVETDSFIAVQLIEKEGVVSLDSLRNVAETVTGSFVFTVLDRKNNLYFVKGDNPISVYHFADRGFYLYASTDEILQKSLAYLGIDKWYSHRVPVDTGDILSIDSNGDIDKAKFRVVDYQQYYWYNCSPRHAFNFTFSAEEEHYLASLKQVAQIYGYNPEDIVDLLAEGFSFSDIEDIIYGGEYENDVVFDRVGV
jgi:glucosamine 6-phosphate synthetase-like amidotransferase/phosphosugar isomerase protein